MTDTQILNPFVALHEQIANLSKDVQKLIADRQTDLPENILTIDEAAQKLNISKVTLHAWNKQGKIKSCRIGGRVFYKQSAIEDALQPRKFSIGN